MPPDHFPLRLGLLPFLKHARHLPAQQPLRPVYVLGNPSADLDSIISAIIYSYFSSSAADRTASRQEQQQQPAPVARPHVPVVNLPDVPAGKELRRLRPEFATALWLSTNGSTQGAAAPDGKNDAVAQLLAEHVLTAADLRGQLLQHFPKDQGSKGLLDSTLVDWNALPFRSTETPSKGSIEGLQDIADLAVIGCIDHHVDESFVHLDEALPEGQPRIIQMGPGSCTSLVVRELRNRGLWLDQSHDSSPSSLIEEAKAAKLALAAILIDTTNLTAEGKVTDVDRAAVAFLEAKVRAGDDPQWDRTAFFEEIQYAKQNSLDLLTVDEMLGRDYKDWVEKSSKRTPGKSTTKIGICSVVKPISWIVEKAQEEDDTPKTGRNSSGAKSFLDKLRIFSQSRDLDVVAVMTAFTSSTDGSFHRELLVWALDEACAELTKRFSKDFASELGLEDWKEDPSGSASTVAAALNSDTPSLHIWHQTNVAKSRKQVAPLLRGVFAD
ncbi:hypothetical protein VTN96DRAFT_10156 [Rasamsonia emersonii]|uniref:Exopolyphosphatase n=1 Tax=Rasamsonia emersonii (strain ATCC 16479 / CBS 393.64 / IMI 116815) TaxID=1408163 RepID=A0A0F4YN15_RASE3|nr:Exopolyphosphatase [Rasamsonia emersonii CBS 393.64]KKA19619.1 Exopolyphosphatase [Rasamsonia emersonii CBS 393.64]